MLLILFGLIAGLALLVWSADRFVYGAVGLSHHFGVPPIVVGIVIIGFGTSAPELLISTMAALQNNSGLAIGNAIGSNIANIGLILGVTACLTAIVATPATLKREFPVLLLATAILWFALQDKILSLGDGVLLIVCLFAALIYLVIAAIRAHEPIELEEQLPANLRVAGLWTLVGLITLLISSKILVTNSIELAQLFGVSDVVIGLTIVAIGTSLPELAASVTGALKHHTDLAIGNVVGSNIFNTLGVIGVPGLIHGYIIPAEVLQRDFPIMLGITLLVMFLLWVTRKGKGMSKTSGILLLLCFIAFQVYLYQQTI